MMKCSVCEGKGATMLTAASGPQKCGVCGGYGVVSGAVVKFRAIAATVKGLAAIDTRGRVWLLESEEGGLAWHLVTSPVDPDDNEDDR